MGQRADAKSQRSASRAVPRIGATGWFTLRDAVHRAARLVLVTLLLTSLITASPLASAGEVTYPDRESTYPPEVVNVTHEPWSPAWGDDVVVTVSLASGAQQPDIVSVLYCRVEPSYACGLPEPMVSSEDGLVWTGRIPWDARFMHDGLVHIGYNVTLFYDDGARVFAPMGNHMLPDTYPEEADGIYYFYAVGPQASALPGPGGFLFVALLMLTSMGMARWGRRSRYAR